jgi:tetratricopeptide (TPR) repeat protein
LFVFPFSKVAIFGIETKGTHRQSTPRSGRWRKMKIIDLCSETLLPSWRKNIFAVVTIFIIILAIYSNTFDASWHFDDESNILKNDYLQLKELTWQNIKRTFFADPYVEGKFYRPVVCLSFALNYYIGGNGVFGYHIVNLIVHFLSSIFLFLFIHRTLNLPLLKSKYGENSYLIALLAAVLWTINPVQTQAVTYVVQRMASMAGMFYIMSMYFYLKGRTSARRPLKATHYLVCLVCGILALGSKENSIMLPVSIFTYDLFLIHGLTKRNIIRSSMVFFALIFLCLSLVIAMNGPSVLNPYKLPDTFKDRGFTLLERLLTEPRVVLFYVSLLLYPMPDRLSIMHDISVSTGLLDPTWTIIAILTILALLGLAVSKSKKWPFVSFCILFFFINHIIESTILPLELVFEHRNYVPSMLFFAPLAILIAKGIRFFSEKRLMQFMICAFVLLVLIAEGHSTFARNFVWRTEETLWLDAAEKSPNLPGPYHNLGRYYDSIGLKEMALAYYKGALKLPEGPNRKCHHLTYHNMALLYKSINQREKAEIYFLKALKLDPRIPNAYIGLGILDTEKGQYQTALANFIKALDFDSSSPQARNYIGLILMRHKKFEGAINQFQEVLRRNPLDPYALTHLGVAYKYKGEFNRALNCFTRVLGINKRYVTAYLHLIEVYSIMGQKDKAKQTAAGLIDLFPGKNLPLLMSKGVIQTDALLEPANLEIILPMLKSAMTDKGIHLDALMDTR